MDRGTRKRQRAETDLVDVGQRKVGEKTATLLDCPAVEIGLYAHGELRVSEKDT